MKWPHRCPDFEAESDAAHAPETPVSDLIQRLRGDVHEFTNGVPLWARMLCGEAADELERLQRELAETRQELQLERITSMGVRAVRYLTEERAERAESLAEQERQVADAQIAARERAESEREQMRAALAELVRTNDAVAVLYELSVVERDDNWDIDEQEAQGELVAAWERARALAPEPQAKEGKNDA